MQQLDVLYTRSVPLIAQLNYCEAAPIFPTAKQVHSYNANITVELETRISYLELLLSIFIWELKPKQIF